MDYTFDNILITGGSGFIGSNYINYLFKNYSNKIIINVDRLDYCSNINNVDKSLNINNSYFFYKTDISNFDYLYDIMNRHNIDTVIHFAAQTHVDNSFCNSVQFVIDNIVGTNYLLEVCRKYNKINKFIHFSTDEVYGEVGLDDSGCTEKSLLNPTNPYAASKAGAEFIVRSYYYSFKIPIVITRCNNAYGPNQYHDKLIPKFINHLLNNEKCTIHGNGTALRTFIHTDDISNAVDIILKKGIINEVYNIGSFNEYNVMDIFDLLVNKLKFIHYDNKNEWLTYVSDRNFNDMRYYVSIDKLTNLGWSEKVNFIDGLNEVISWYINNIFKENLNDDLKKLNKSIIDDFKINLDFNSLKISEKITININHNLSNNYNNLEYSEKLNEINNNLFLSWVYKTILSL